MIITPSRLASANTVLPPTDNFFHWLSSCLVGLNTQKMGQLGESVIGPAANCHFEVSCLEKLCGMIDGCGFNLISMRWVMSIGIKGNFTGNYYALLICGWVIREEFGNSTRCMVDIWRLSQCIVIRFVHFCGQKTWFFPKYNLITTYIRFYNCRYMIERIPHDPVGTILLQRDYDILNFCFW